MNKNNKLSMLAVVMFFTAAYILGFISPALAQDKIQIMVNNRTCFPIRWVAEALGMQVTWDANSRTVKVTSVLDAAPGTKPMAELTTEAKERLMGYAYPVDQNGKQYEVRHLMVEYNKLPSRDGRTLLEHMMVPIQENKVLKTNQRFITDGDLCYTSLVHNGSRIRGILQITNQDGTITEQDIEYGYTYGAPFVKPGEDPIPSHWFSDYDTVQLSVPLRVK